MRTRIYYLVWQYGPTAAIREWGWFRWLDSQWLKPAPVVKPRVRRIDRDTEDTGIEDPRLAA